MAQKPLVMTFTVDNSLPHSFSFNANTPSGNQCTNSGPNQVTCTISDINAVPFVVDLTWASQKNPRCLIDLAVTQDLNNGGYRLNTLASDYGFSIAPGTHWDGKSNLSAHMIISAVRTSGC